MSLPVLSALYQRLARLLGNRGGYVAITTALCLPAIAGAAALGTEVAVWFLTARQEQNAADSAAVAAAINGTASYANEAKAVAAKYGFRDGVNNVTVVASNTAACPAGGTNSCYSVTITALVPQYLSRIVGFQGTTIVGSVHYTSVHAVAIAGPTGGNRYCMLALAGSGATGIRSNGAPKANMAGCSLASNTGATCNGHNLGADVVDAHGTDNGCGVVQNSNMPIVPDPYVSLASNIPADPCGGNYPQEPAKKKDPPLPGSNQWVGTKALSGNSSICGDLQLTGNVTINAPAGAVLTIYNGQLDTNGYTLKTSSGSALTVAFSGTNGGGYTHAPTGGGTLDIAAPTSGPWSGVALYQDPALTAGVDISYSGNSPTWDISGLVYLPHASVTVSGAVNKSSNGNSCFVIVVDNVTINGTGSILANGDCASAGLTMPAGNQVINLVY